MSGWAVILVSILYAYTGIEKAFEGHWWWTVVWLSYALANIALLKAMP